MQPPARPGFHRPALIIGVGLFALAAVTWFDARSMTIRANYGMGADAASYFVAAFLAALGAGHLIAAMRPGIRAGDTDWAGVGWVMLALVGLAVIASIVVALVLAVLAGRAALVAPAGFADPALAAAIE